MPSVPKPVRKPKRNPRRVWAVQRAAWLAEHPTCQMAEYAVDAGPCVGGLQVHHVQPRGMGGSRRTDLALATLCLGHHGWVEGNRAAARSLGLLQVKSWGQAKDTAHD